MFFYTSFLRPPPQTSDVASPISVTPQIANDLRTSHFNDATDVFYVWSPSLRDCAKSSIVLAKRKLTTWRESSMYKSLSMALPSNAKVGQEWRLALTACADANFVIDLCERPFGTRPLPVVSMPVQLEEKGKSRSPVKQERIERLYTIEPGKPSTLLSIREQTSFDLDKKIWDSGLGLCSWLTHLLLSESGDDPSTHRLKATLGSQRENDGLRVLELGAGTGIVSVCLSALLERLQHGRGTRVLATDLHSALDLIEHNIMSNKHSYPTLTLEAAALDWEEEMLPTVAQGPIDLLIMADVTYNTASFPALVRTLHTLLDSSQTTTERRTPAILLAYKHRDPSERELWPMLHDIGIDVRLVGSVDGAGVEAVEIWLWDEGLGVES